MTARDYITRAGWQKLADELDYLWREKRPHVVRALTDAAAEGDRSENAESPKEPLNKYYLFLSSYFNKKL